MRKVGGFMSKVNAARGRKRSPVSSPASPDESGVTGSSPAGSTKIVDAPPVDERSVIRMATPREQRVYGVAPIMLLPLPEVVEMLTCSVFMRPWIGKKVAEALASGEVFELKDGEALLASYKLATQDEVLDLA